MCVAKGHMMLLAHCRSQTPRADNALPFLLVTGGGIEQEAYAVIRAKKHLPEAVSILGLSLPLMREANDTPRNRNPIPSQVTATSKWASTQGLGRQMSLVSLVSS